MGKTIQTSEQPRMIDRLRPSNQRQATHPRAVGLQQSEQLIWERSDCDKPYQGMIDQKQEQVQVPAKVWGPRSGSGTRGLEPARGLEPTAEALKIQEV